MQTSTTIGSKSLVHVTGCKIYSCKKTHQKLNNTVSSSLYQHNIKTIYLRWARETFQYVLYMEVRENNFDGKISGELVYIDYVNIQELILLRT